MSDEESFDADAAMMEAMGFSSFATRRPKDESLSSASNGNNSSESQTFGSSSTLSQTTDHSMGNNPRQPADSTPGGSQTSAASAIVFSSAASNTHYTKAELDAWARGKINSNGDLVFFKPGFVTDDPWARFRGKNQTGT